MWLGILLICSTPHISSCEILVHSELFKELEECSARVFLDSQQFSKRQNLFTLGRCIAVPVINV